MRSAGKTYTINNINKIIIYMRSAGKTYNHEFMYLLVGFISYNTVITYNLQYFETIFAILSSS